MTWLTNWFSQLHSTFIEGERYKMILEGLGNTAIIAPAPRGVDPLAVRTLTSSTGVPASRAWTISRKNSRIAAPPVITVCLRHIMRRHLHLYFITVPPFRKAPSPW